MASQTQRECGANTACDGAHRQHASKLGVSCVLALRVSYSEPGTTCRDRRRDPLKANCLNAPVFRVPANSSPQRKSVYSWASECSTIRVPSAVPVQREMESGRSPLVSIPPFGRGFSRHRGLPIRSDFWKSAEAEPPRSGHRLDEPARLSLGMVASLQSPLPFRLASSL